MGKLFKQMGLAITGCLILVALGVQAAAQPEEAQATNNIEKIDFSSLSGGKVNIKVTLTQPLENAPAGFALNNPPRIALDFPNVSNGTQKASYTVDQAMLRSLSLAQGKGRTRMVLDLTKVSSYTTSLNGKEVSILLQPQEGVALPQTNVTKFAEAIVADQKHVLNSIDFMRGKNGEGRVVVDLSDVGTGES